MSSVTSTANLTDFTNRKTNVGVDTSVFRAYEIISDTIVANHIDAPSGGLDLNGIIGINTESTSASEITTIAGTPAAFTQTMYIGCNDGTTYGNNIGDKIINIATTTGTNSVSIGGSSSSSISLQSPITYKIASMTVTSTPVILTANDSGKIIFLALASGAIITLPTAAVGLNFTFIVKTSLSSGSYKIQGASSADLLYGGVAAIGTTGPTVSSKAPNNTTDCNMSMFFNSSGGQVGTEVKFVSTGTNVWVVGGTTISATTGGTFFFDNAP